MNKFTFDNSIDPKTGKKRHIYKLDGKRLTGTTTILGVIAKPALYKWYSKMAVEAMVAGKTPEEALKAGFTFRDKTADIGTSVHSAIEEWIKEKKEPVLDEMGMKMFSNFKEWAEKNKVKFLASEQKLYSKLHWTAGTADFLCKIDGQTYLGDIKTSSGIYDRTPFAQCASYRMMLKEMTGKECGGSIIVNIKKTGVFDEDKDVHLSTYYEDDLNLFLSALQIYRIMGSFEPMNNYYKSNKKTIRI